MLGETTLAKLVELRTEILVDETAAMTTLMAAAMAEALRLEEPPRKVLDSLWECVPSDDAWRGGMAEKVASACEDLGY